MKKKQDEKSSLWKLRRQNELLRRQLEGLKLRTREQFGEDDELETLLRQITREAHVFAKNQYKLADPVAKALCEDLLAVLSDEEKSALASTEVFSKHTGLPEASMRPIPEGKLILIDVHLFRFIFSLTKCLLPVLLDSGWSYLYLDLELSIRLRKFLKAAGELGRHYGMLLQYLALGGTYEGPDPSILAIPPFGSFEHHLLAITVANVEQFIIAHEVAHILLRHSGHSSAVREEEFEADALALDLVLRTTGKKRFIDMPEAGPWRMEGALLLLSYLEFLEKSASIQLEGSPHQHPSASERVDSLSQRRSLDLMFSNDIVRLGLPANTQAVSIIPSVRRFLAEAVEY